MPVRQDVQGGHASNFCSLFKRMNARGEVIRIGEKLVVVADLLRVRQQHKQVMDLRYSKQRPQVWQELNLTWREFMWAIREYERRFAVATFYPTEDGSVTIAK
jgi:hypothetical protein